VLCHQLVENESIHGHRVVEHGRRPLARAAVAGRSLALRPLAARPRCGCWPLARAAAAGRSRAPRSPVTKKRAVFVAKKIRDKISRELGSRTWVANSKMVF
jgi:hypothetical protein